MGKTLIKEHVNEENQTENEMIEAENQSELITEDSEDVKATRKSVERTSTMVKPEISEECKEELQRELEVIRKICKWSQKDICEALGTATTQVTAVEREEKHFTDTQYFVLLYLLHLELKTNERLKRYVDTMCSCLLNELSKFAFN